MRRVLFTTTAIASAIVVSLVFTACSSDSSGSSSGGASEAGAVQDTGTVDSSPATGGDAGPDAPAPAVSCAAFCASVMKNCTGANQQFASADVCSTICQDFRVGAYGDSDNTTGCRQAHADLAAQNPGKECLAAGPFGADVCGKRCDSFCMEVVDRCSGAAAVYNSVDQCDQQCGSSFTFDPNKPELTQSGNTLNCREGWISKTMVGNPDAGDLTTDCQNAGPSTTTCK